jgi:hypothetical protein
MSKEWREIDNVQEEFDFFKEHLFETECDAFWSYVYRRFGFYEEEDFNKRHASWMRTHKAQMLVYGNYEFLEKHGRLLAEKFGYELDLKTMTFRDTKQSLVDSLVESAGMPKQPKF